MLLNLQARLLLFGLVLELFTTSANTFKARYVLFTDEAGMQVIHRCDLATTSANPFQASYVLFTG